MSSVSNAASLNQAQISIARQQLDQIEQEGRDAVTLIQAAKPPPAGATPANVAAGVGTQVSFTA